LCERATWWRFESQADRQDDDGILGPDIPAEFEHIVRDASGAGVVGAWRPLNMIAHELLLRFLDARDLPTGDRARVVRFLPSATLS
jgi:hypothetical protein